MTSLRLPRKATRSAPPPYQCTGMECTCATSAGASKFEISIVLSNYSDVQFSNQVQIQVRGRDGEYRNPCTSDTARHAHTPGQSNPFSRAAMGNSPAQTSTLSSRQFRELCRLWRQLCHIAPTKRDSILPLKKLSTAVNIPVPLRK